MPQPLFLDVMLNRTAPQETKLARSTATICRVAGNSWSEVVHLKNACANRRSAADSLAFSIRTNS